MKFSSIGIVTYSEDPLLCKALDTIVHWSHHYKNITILAQKHIKYEGNDIVPLKFLKAVLPEPSSLGENYTGKTNIGCMMKGIKDGRQKKIYIYNVCDHAECYKEVKSQAISYTTGVPTMIGAMMMLEGIWTGKGVYNVEELDPDPFMEKLNIHGLPWVVEDRSEE